jgi:ubiquitin C-terminal hydrolase
MINLYNVLSRGVVDGHLQLVKHDSIFIKKEVFIALWNIVKEACTRYQNDEVDVRVLKALRNVLKILYPDMADYIQQDADEVLIRLLEIIRLIADQTNQLDSYSDAFEITSTVMTNYNETRLEVEHAVRVSPDKLNFEQWINQNYTGILKESVNNYSIKRRIYHKLPYQLVAILERRKNGSAVPYPFPIEFKTHDSQCYTFVSAIIHNAVSLSCGHYFTLVRRQEHVYIYDDDRIVGCLQIDDLSNYLKKVIVTSKETIEYIFNYGFF